MVLRAVRCLLAWCVKDHDTCRGFELLLELAEEVLLEVAGELLALEEAMGAADVFLYPKAALMFMFRGMDMSSWGAVAEARKILFFSSLYAVLRAMSFFFCQDLKSSSMREESF